MSCLYELQSLNPQQRSAVEQVNGRLLILAGAGSGKTRVLTLRMAYLIEQKKIPPQAILGLTFTNKAAAEMRHRLATFIDPALAKHVTLCTFHSFCMQVLRRDIAALGYTREFSLYDEQDVQRLLNTIARDLLQCNGELPSLKPTVDAIRSARNKGLTAEQIEGTGSDWHDQFTGQVYTRLQASMRAYNAVDFDSLLSLTVQLFVQFPEILHTYQNRFQFVMIDEYQDTNPIQYRLADLLTAKSQNLCVVGDDDQSIYGWRGADIKNILAFDKATVVKLEQNYRSTNTILKAANAVIGNNQQRHVKSLWSDKGDGEKIEVFHAPNELEEVQSVLRRMIRLKETGGLRWNDMAILYRSNSLARQFELGLMKAMWRSDRKYVQGIPYEVVGGLEFYERKEVKDLCAYLRVIVNPCDQEALLRIINQPRRGIGEDTLDLLTAYNRKHNISLWQVLLDVLQGHTATEHLQVHNRAFKGITQLVTILEEAKLRFATVPLAPSLQWLVQQVNYEQAIKEEVKSQQMRDFKMENVQEFIASLAEFDSNALNNPQADCSLATFVANLMLADRMTQFNVQQRHADHVHLMTFHSAKGLEFPACFLIGVEDQIIPHEKSMQDTGIEEERRLMYVAMTRAKNYLTISMAQLRKRFGKEAISRPSPFLFEIPKHLLCPTDWRN